MMVEHRGYHRTEEFTVGFRMQDSWRFPIALYFFFSGTGAGLFLFSLLFCSPLSVLLDIVFLGIGAIILFFDLGNRWKFWRAFAKPWTSWISRGTFLITILFIFDLLYIGLGFPSLPWPITLLAGMVGILILFYPGLVISYSPSISLWNSSLIPVLFALHSVANSLSMGLIIHSDFGPLKKELLLFLLLGVLLFLLLGTGVFLLVSYASSKGTLKSICLLTQAPLKTSFLSMGIMVGILLPVGLLIGVLKDLLPLSVLSYLCAMRFLGDIGFRYAILKAGAYEPLV
jgi:formate-dependent nitrite reductase membrane component NrfD